MTTAAPTAAFALLGLAPTTDIAAIRKAWRALVRTNHPDCAKGCKDAATRRMAQINAAFDLAWVWSQQAARADDTADRAARARAAARAQAEAKAEAAAREAREQARAQAKARAEAAARAEREEKARAKAEAAARAEARARAAATARARAEAEDRAEAQRRAAQQGVGTSVADYAKARFSVALSAIAPKAAPRQLGFL